MNLYKVTIYYPKDVQQIFIAEQITIKDNTLTISALGTFNIINMYEQYVEAPKNIIIHGFPFHIIEITPSEFKKLKQS